MHVGLLYRIDEEYFTKDENYEINNDIYNKCNIDIDDRLTLEEFTSVDDISEIFEIDSITEIIDSLTNNNKDSDDTQEAGFDPTPSSEKAIQGFESLTAPTLNVTLKIQMIYIYYLNVWIYYLLIIKSKLLLYHLIRVYTYFIPL